jgi:hypothetical protein
MNRMVSSLFDVGGNDVKTRNGVNAVNCAGSHHNRTWVAQTWLVYMHSYSRGEQWWTCGSPIHIPGRRQSCASPGFASRRQACEGTFPSALPKTRQNLGGSEISRGCRFVKHVWRRPVLALCFGGKSLNKFTYIISRWLLFTVLVTVSVQTCCSSRFPYDHTESVYVLIENQVCINCRKNASDEFADTVTLLTAHKYARMEASKSIYMCAS